VTVPKIVQDDLEHLRAVFPHLDFTDPERAAVLLEAGTRDVNAAPGSGKTTLLVAKLHLLAKYWPHPRRGVCVLSHTNVARDEIASGLTSTAVGGTILEYPHFVGTIHSFLNQFLALPWLQSRGQKVVAIDDELFAQKALRLTKYKPNLKSWMAHDSSVAEVVQTLRYEGGTLQLGCSKGKVPKPDSASFKELKEIKEMLSEDGIYRYEDMFAFAEQVLTLVPELRARLSHRFPILLVDEMQDTSWAQETMLDKIFDESVVVQRFGDLNQQILLSDDGKASLTFPRGEYLSVGSSKRFAPSIARIVSSLRIEGTPVVCGEREETGRLPTIFVYDDSNIRRVIERFGELVLDTFSDEELFGQRIKALCSKKKGDAKSGQGRHLGDYWPPFNTIKTKPPANAWHLLSDTELPRAGYINLRERAVCVRQLVFLAIREAESQFVVGIRDGSELFKHLEIEGVMPAKLRKVCRNIAVARGLTGSVERWSKMVARLYRELQPLLPNGFSHLKFENLEVFRRPAGIIASDAESRICIVTKGGRELKIQIGTIASVKGETHLASLVLESHGGNSRQFDMSHALTLIGGGKLASSSKLLAQQMKSLFVGMSRPSHLLCVAIHSGRLPPDSLTGLKQAGWSIERL
jgi:DNA helicase-2/ATP-dependent DNA helicase PcrA